MNGTAPARLLSLVLLVSCSGGIGPTRAELEGRLGESIPPSWEIRSFAVEASENLGTTVEPLVKSRFKAEVQLREDTYTVGHITDDISFLKPVGKKGERREVYGVAGSVQKAGSWQTVFDFENDLFYDSGFLLDSSSERMIVIGSPEETAFLEQKAAIEKAAIEKRSNVIVAVLTADRSFTGIRGSGPFTRVQFKIRFQSFDQASGVVKAEMSWNASGVPDLFEGLLVGDTLTLTKHPRSGEDREITYTFALADSGVRLEGQSGPRDWTGEPITINLD